MGYTAEELRALRSVIERAEWALRDAETLASRRRTSGRIRGIELARDALSGYDAGEAELAERVAPGLADAIRADVRESINALLPKAE